MRSRQRQGQRMGDVGRACVVIGSVDEEGSVDKGPSGPVSGKGSLNSKNKCGYIHHPPGIHKQLTYLFILPFLKIT